MEKQIIALCGDKFHGKDTFANFFVKHYGFQRLVFADPLKECAAVAFGLPVAEFHDVALKETVIPGYPGWTYRKVLEFLGTEVFRTNFEGIWKNTLENKLKASQGGRFVVTDMRFIDEGDMLRKHGARLVRIVNPRVDATPDIGECQRLKLHPSMWMHKLIDVDSVIENSDTVDALEHKAHTIYAQFFGGY
ncbi:MAG: hypothetical protein E6R03_16215 [Hyphomicrobiaceae bacterium]|nr:MAG: hypothetical protein E6R03_16215 [Hyphomicrobiaceae bacterium]